ncbi:Y+L amino acid transporter 2-like isoform X1 [Planococcus citri]|uniref:Y+L amino acid transporter 2-like isoform X1 n=1 Tax=Planococcus citri TaxID=170843 RepID=UPI0031F94962
MKMAGTPMTMAGDTSAGTGQPREREREREREIERSYSSDAFREKFQMKKELGLLEGVAIILGIILGSGIFISPSGVYEEAGSSGFTLVIWVLCGVLSMIGAMCYAELGTSILKSGGDYAYIREGYGSLPAFLFLWDAVVVFVPTTNAIMGLTFANYITQPFFPGCAPPDAAVRLLAAVIICFLTFINCYDVKLTTRAQNIFMFAKIGAVSVIIVVGLAALYFNKGANFENLWQGTTNNPGKMAIAFYSGIFCYSGWSYLNFMTEELKDPYVNLPRAIYISVPIVTLIYVLANVAYISVLTPQEMISSHAIAVTFAEHIFGSFTWIMSLMVAVGAAGSLSVHIMTSSRMCFVGARSGHFPVMLSYINIHKLTPTPSLVFMSILSLVMLCTSDIYVLITYSSFVESFFIMLSVFSVLLSRWNNPNLQRPIRVPLVVPIIFVIVSLFLVILPCYVRPVQVAIGVSITLAGLPVYFLFIQSPRRSSWFHNVIEESTRAVQKLFLCTCEDDA